MGETNAFLMIPAKEAKSLYHNAHKYSFELIENDILRIFIKKNVEIEVEDLVELRELLLKNFGISDFPLLLIFDKFATISQDARKFIENPHLHLFKTIEAIVVSSLSQRILINFMIHQNSLAHKQKLFRTEDKAKAWLERELKLIGRLRII